MKKNLFRCLICLTLVLALVLANVSVAENADLSAMSDDEIVALLGRLQEEMVSRGMPKKAKLPAGRYIGGQDLPCGKYIYTCMAVGDDWGNVTVYSDGGKGKQLLWEVVAAPKEGEEPETFMVSVDNGDELKSGVPFNLTIFAGVQFN